MCFLGGVPLGFVVGGGCFLGLVLLHLRLSDGSRSQGIQVGSSVCREF